MAVNPINTPPGKSWMPRTGESLITWRQPRAYGRKGLLHGRWVTPLILCFVPALLLDVSAYNHNFSKRSLVILIVLVVIGLGCFLIAVFADGPAVCLKDDYLATAGGNSPIQLSYDRMDSCTVRLDSFDGKKFAILTFIMKEQPGFLAIKHMEFGAPDDASLKRILAILRMKGVNVIEQ